MSGTGKGDESGVWAEGVREPGRRWIHLVGCVLLAGACVPFPDAPSGLSPGDARSIRAVDEAYVRGWEANDSAAVMATVAADGVLLPDRMAPIRGDSAIRAYWWPDDGSETRITSYETRIDEVGGSGAIAYLRGTGSLAFDWRAGGDAEWQSFSSRSVWLALLRREEDGAWRMTHRMWHRVEGDG